MLCLVCLCWVGEGHMDTKFKQVYDWKKEVWCHVTMARLDTPSWSKQLHLGFQDPMLLQPGNDLSCSSYVGVTLFTQFFTQVVRMVNAQMSFL